ncbi:transposase [Novosphingobium chloroacetimidivorans]|uniref:Transposase n=1 Tax=Novosphingobium chloroacetimidivorans TaxID=1428314 RepID=A0A7W7KE54_9SPHN|nr:transposase [Novosphingobium chloroacetimidivorans]MBB4860574.1 transposase [Novosphingobium chloroacetimidivorans]
MESTQDCIVDETGRKLVSEKAENSPEAFAAMLERYIIVSQSQACEILMTIPGVGVQTSAAFAAAMDEAGRFRQSRNAGAYFCLLPRRHNSGELDWTGRITKQRDGSVRKLLYEAANSVLTRSRETFALRHGP